MAAEANFPNRERRKSGARSGTPGCGDAAAEALMLDFQRKIRATVDSKPSVPG